MDTNVMLDSCKRNNFDEFMLDDNIGYNHVDSVKLLNGLRSLFQGKLKMVGIEWVSENSGISDNSNDSTGTGTNLFVISNSKEAPYLRCNGIDDVEGIFNDFSESLTRLADNLYFTVDNNKNLDDDTKNNIENYAASVDKAATIFENQKKRRTTKIKEMSSVDEIRDEIRNLSAEIISKYVIMVLVDALYERIKNNSGEVYKIIVSDINQFLMDNGVITREISVGEELNPDYTEPTADSAENFTDDYSKFEKIEEVRRYPYFFSDGYKILDGTAKIWIKKEGADG